MTPPTSIVRRDPDVDPVIPGIRRHVVHGDRMTAIVAYLDAGALLPRHTHEAEQLTTVLSGSLRITVWDGDAEETVDVGPGETILIRPNILHETLALADAECREAFAPPRLDIPATGA